MMRGTFSRRDIFRLAGGSGLAGASGVADTGRTYAQAAESGFSSSVASAQNNNCTYWEFTDEQIDNLIKYFIQEDLPDEHIQILKEMQNSSSTISYLYRTKSEFRYDNLDNSESVPVTFGSNIRIIEENEDGTDEYSDYFNDHGSVDCDSIPFETPAETPTRTPAPTETPAETPTRTPAPTESGSSNPTDSPIEQPTISSNSEQPGSFNGFLNQFLITLLSTEALAALSTAVVVVLMVVVWNNSRE